MCRVIPWWQRPGGGSVVDLLNWQGKLVSGNAMEQFIVKTILCLGKHDMIFVQEGVMYNLLPEYSLREADSPLSFP